MFVSKRIMNVALCVDVQHQLKIVMVVRGVDVEFQG